MPRTKKTASPSTRKKGTRTARKTPATGRKSGRAAVKAQSAPETATAESSPTLDKLKAKRSRTKSRRKPVARTSAMARLLEKVGLHI